jgi:hypothetical protein
VRRYNLEQATTQPHCSHQIYLLTYSWQYQFCHNDFHKGEILSERLSIKIDTANYMSTSKSDGNSVAELLPAPNYIFSPNITTSEPHQQQSILMHNHRLQQQKVLAEGPRSGSSDDARAVHYNDTRSSSSVILSDHGGVKTMIWKDNFPIRGAENPSETYSNTTGRYQLASWI